MDLTQVKMGRIDIREQAFRTAIRVGLERAAWPTRCSKGIYWWVQRYKDAASELERYLTPGPNAKDADKTRKSIDELRKKVG